MFSILDNLEQYDSQYQSLLAIQNSIDESVANFIDENNIHQVDHIFDSEGMKKINFATQAKDNLIRHIGIEFMQKHSDSGVVVTFPNNIKDIDFSPSKYAKKLHEKYFGGESNELDKQHADSIIRALDLTKGLKFKSNKGGIEIQKEFNFDTRNGYKVGSCYHHFCDMAKAFRFIGSKAQIDWFEDLAGAIERNFSGYFDQLETRHVYGVEDVAEIRVFKNGTFKLWLSCELSSGFISFIEKYGFDD